MYSSTKNLLAIGSLIICVVTFIPTQVQRDQVNRGQEWLTWTEGQRNTYIQGLVSGYQAGTLQACNAANNLFEIGQVHQLGDDQHPSEVPSARCLALMGKYSKCKNMHTYADCSAYTGTITEFYTKHPAYRGIPFPYLFEFLSDSKHKTADELYQMALKKEMQTSF